MYLCKRQEPGRPGRRGRRRIRRPATTFSRQRMWDRLVRAPAMSTTRTPGRRRRRRVRRTVATPGPARLQGKRPSRRQICHRLLRGPSTCKPCEEASPGRGVSFTVRIARAEWFSGRTAWTGGGFWVHQIPAVSGHLACTEGRRAACRRRRGLEVLCVEIAETAAQSVKHRVRERAPHERCCRPVSFIS